MAVGNTEEVRQLVADYLHAQWREERDKLDRLDKWYSWEQEDFILPRSATPELKALFQLAKTPWLRLVVAVISQSMHVDGYRSPNRAEPLPAWQAWQRNDWDARQVPVHRDGLKYGYDYAIGLPGDNGAVMRGMSPRRLQAYYEEPERDEWPLCALQIDPHPRGGEIVRVYDDEFVYKLHHDVQLDRWTVLEDEVQYHGIGVCPIVRYSNMMDLEGRHVGEVEPYIATAQRINKTVYDRLLTQHFNSWKVRTIAGMAEPDSEEKAIRQALDLRRQDLLVSDDPDTKFGTLPETPLDGFIRATQEDVQTLAAVSQTPAHALTGQLVNLSADALAAARSELDHKINERKLSFGKSHAQLLRLVAHIEGDAEGAEDYEAHVTWQDSTVRSFSQAADALGKIATQLEVPPKALWTMIPGVSELDFEEWKNLYEEAKQEKLEEAERIAREGPGADVRAEGQQAAADAAAAERE